MSFRWLAIASLLFVYIGGQARGQEAEACADAAPLLPIGLPFSGVLTSKAPQGQVPGVAGFSNYHVKYTVRLPEKKGVSVVVTCDGDDRSIGVALLDSQAALIKAAGPAKESANFKVTQVPLADEYTIVVASPTIGNFDLLVTIDGEKAVAPLAAPADADALERRIREIELELDAIKAQLRILKAKSQ